MYLVGKDFLGGKLKAFTNKGGATKEYVAAGCVVGLRGPAWESPGRA